RRSRPHDARGPGRHRPSLGRRRRARGTRRLRGPGGAARAPFRGRRNPPAARARELPRRRGRSRLRRSRRAHASRARGAAGRGDHRPGRRSILPRATRALAAGGRMTVLEATAVSAAYGARTVLRDCTLSLASGDVLAVVGPNGAGKSTLLRVLAGLLRPRAGSVSLDAADIASLSRAAIARRIAVVPQILDTLFPFTVREIVGLGRTARLGRFGGASAGDAAAVDRAIAELELGPLASRRIDRLPGGDLRERSRGGRAQRESAGVPSGPHPLLDHFPRVARRASRAAREASRASTAASRATAAAAAEAACSSEISVFACVRTRRPCAISKAYRTKVFAIPATGTARNTPQNPARRDPSSRARNTKIGWIPIALDMIRGPRTLRTICWSASVRRNTQRSESGAPSRVTASTGTCAMIGPKNGMMIARPESTASTPANGTPNATRMASVAI